MRLRGFVWSFGIVACAVFAAGVACWLCAGRNAVGAAARVEQARVDAESAAKVPVLVELFTSEGCSSCPPADALLGRLDREQPLRGAKIIVLSEHVDYWNNGGWQDRFSSAALTQRQQAYGDLFKLNDVYTPQMVVNGAAQMNGTDGKAIAAALEQASASHPISLEIASVVVRGKEVTFTIRNGMLSTPGDVNVYAALVDPEDTTKVGGGENHGRTLQHTGVVRVLDRVGTASRTRSLGEKPFVFKGDVSGRSGLDGMRLVVFVQKKQIGPVLGADECLITSAMKIDGGPVGPCPSSGS